LDVLCGVVKNRIATCAHFNMAYCEDNAK